MRGIVESYVRPGQVGSKFLDDEESFALFANTEELFLLHRELYKAVRETLLTWTSDSCISGVFEILANAPEVYRVYSANQTDALAFAEQLRFELRIADNE